VQITVTMNGFYTVCNSGSTACSTAYDMIGN
jgi:hypothetical protein